ncbi:MAG: hypothetical protein LBP23_01365 [Treponema sp.]|jgi:hypothetical protein|nr:hypothetical protein [Treponema sp.]
MAYLTKEQQRLVWNLLFSLSRCFNEDGTLTKEYYQNVILFDLKKEEKEFLDSFLTTLTHQE